MTHQAQSKEVIQALQEPRPPMQPEELRKAVTRGVANCANEIVRALNVRNSLIGAGMLAAALLAGAVGGYLYHGAAPIIAGVSAGAQQCQDQKGGDQICWIPVWGRLPPAK